MAHSSPWSRAHPTDRLVGQAPALQELRAQIRHLAAFDTLGNAFVPTLLLQAKPAQARDWWPGSSTRAVRAYAVVGVGPRRSPLEVYGKRPLSPFVGRERELAALRDLLARAEQGRGQVVALVGEPDVGKSRLCYELTQVARPHGWRIVESSPTAYGKETPYLSVIDLLKAYFQVDARDEVRTMRDKITEKLQTLDEGHGPTLPAVLALLDVPVEDVDWQALDPPQRRQRTLEACKRLLLRESQVQPLLLVVEKLHWIDTETQAVLDSLVDSLPAARILLVVNYRPEYQHGWGGKTYYTQLRLDPLPPAHADELLRALLGGDTSLSPLKQLLIARTEGNPFFLEESVRTLVETQVLVGEPGLYRLAQTLPVMPVPATVQAVLAACIDGLPPEEKQLLQTAAVIGTAVPLALLQAVAEVPKEALRLGLTYLQIAEFLYETRLFPEHEYTFKHALTLEAAYGSLLQERRRGLHAKIVEVIERLSSDRLAEQVEQLAQHALRGEVWDKALAYCRQAGEKTLARSAYCMGAYDQAIAAAQRALALATASGDVVLHALAHYYLGPAYMAQGNYPRAIDCYTQTVASLGGMRRHERFGQMLLPTVSSRAFLAECHAELGTFAAGRVLGDEGLRMAEAVKHSASLMMACHGMGLLSLHQGDLSRALLLLERAVHISQDTDLPILFPRLAAALGAAYTWTGRVANAVPLLTQAMEQITARAVVNFQVPCGLALGEAQLRADCLEEAHGLAEHALTLARERQDRGNEAYALRLRGDIAARREPPERKLADAYYREALNLAKELGMRPLQAYCHLGLGTLYAKTSRPEPARAELSAAIARYRAMAMTFWLPQAEAALARSEKLGASSIAW